MLINWFTVAAQVVNFLILAVLLKRFLYGPIVRAMAAREERIASEMAAGGAKEAGGGAGRGCHNPEDARNPGEAPGDAGPAEREVETYRQNFSIRPDKMWLKSNKNGPSP